MLSLFVSGAVDALWMTRQFPDKSITSFFGKRRQYSWSRTGQHINILLVMLGVLCHAFREYMYKNKRRKEERWNGYDWTRRLSKKTNISCQKHFVHRQNTPTMAQWSLFSVNPDSQMFVKRNRHTTIHQIPSFLWEVFPKGLQSSTTNKLNWFSVM